MRSVLHLNMSEPPPGKCATFRYDRSGSNLGPIHTFSVRLMRTPLDGNMFDTLPYQCVTSLYYRSGSHLGPTHTFKVCHIRSALGIQLLVTHMRQVQYQPDDHIVLRRMCLASATCVPCSTLTCPTHSHVSALLFGTKGRAQILARPIRLASARYVPHWASNFLSDPYV